MGLGIIGQQRQVRSLVLSLQSRLFLFASLTALDRQRSYSKRHRRSGAIGPGVAAHDMNQVLSDLIAQLRENRDKTNDVTGRAVIAPPGETLAMLPKAANRLNQGACFDSSGNLAPYFHSRIDLYRWQRTTEWAHL